ncbi:TrmB family transcriptional regulator sugar-binding domain-containing protein [Haloarcula sp. GH36]|uniref:TrmB family transcriptional regulator sugar-binding domain-containing protein n=1 Tax=Haloarcula montana TaxID=3111776 RepID=UPI002D766355|nr:TrmB family transcriptional regulator sugar-binding domain-containing protein [Haloarcula sp. GH36]
MAETVAQLARFGLSETEARTYVAVLERGSATIAELSTATDISTGYVYDLVERLDDRGLVVVDDHRTPTQVRAVDPESAIESMTEELSELATDLAERHTEAEPDYPAVELVRTRETLYDRLERLVGNASQEVFLSVPAPAIDRLTPALERAVRRGVFVAVLLGTAGVDGPVDVERIARGTHVVRTWEATVASLAAADGRVSITSDSSLLHGQHRQGEYGLAIEQSPKNATAILSQWSNFWAAGEQIYRADSPSLPLETVSFRHGLFAIATHDDPHSLAVTAHLLPDQDRETLTGRVVETKQGLVDPVTAEFTGQNGLVLDVDGTHHSVGGSGAYTEAFAADHLSVRERE